MPFALHPQQANVHPRAEGIPYRRWRMQQITEQANSPEVREYMKRFYVDGKPPLNLRAEATARDSYGWRS